MAIFVFVLFIFFLICVFGSSAHDGASATSDFEAMKHSWDLWKKNVMYSDEEEQELNEATYSPSRYWKMEKSALEVIHSLPGLEYAEFKDKGVPRKHEESRIIVRLIEAVKRGRVPQTINGTIPPLENALDMYVSKGAYVEFGRWLEQTIRENGAESAELYAQALGGYKAMVWGPYQRLFGSYTNGTTEVQNIRVTDPIWIEKINAFSSELCDELNAPIIARNKERLRLHEEWRAEREGKEAERKEAGNDIFNL